MRDAHPDRRAARAAGHRRVQTVTTWTAAGSVLAAALLAAALAHGTAAARTASTDQLQTPDNAPGPVLGGGGGLDNGGPDNDGGGGGYRLHGGSGGS